MSKPKIEKRPIIGWREWVSLPDLGIRRVKAKVDSGARSSAIHAIHVKPFDRDGEEWVRFEIHPIQRNSRKLVKCEAKVLEYRTVRSSSGKATRRPVIVTNVTLLGVTFEVELTLANRDEMGFRMLLGREAFRNRFLVDAANSFYGGQPKRMKKRFKGKTNITESVETNRREMT